MFSHREIEIVNTAESQRRRYRCDDLIKLADRMQPIANAMYFINSEVNRDGGPEEGGWYYHTMIAST